MNTKSCKFYAKQIYDATFQMLDDDPAYSGLDAGKMAHAAERGFILKCKVTHAHLRGRR